MDVAVLVASSSLCFVAAYLLTCPYMHGRGTPDIPRFRALRRDNTPSPAEFSWMVDSTMSLLELYGGGRRLAKARAAPSLRCCYVVASPCWKYALEAIIKWLLLYFLVHDNCLLFML